SNVACGTTRSPWTFTVTSFMRCFLSSCAVRSKTHSAYHVLWISYHLCQCHLRLRQPEHHLHGAIHRDGSGQLSAGLLTVTGPGIQGAQPEVAVGHERTHAEFLGQGEGLPVVSFGWLDLRRVLMGGDLPEEPQGPRLMPPFLMGTGEVEGTP